MRLSNIAALATRPMGGRVWYRAVPAAHLGTPLGYAHSTYVPGRYNPGTRRWPQFPVLYFCDDPFICRFEVGTLLGVPSGPGPVVTAPAAGLPPVVIAVHVTLSAVVDLTRAVERRAVRTTAQELSGDWTGYRLRRPTVLPAGPLHLTAPTQRLGSALYNLLGVEGFLAYSAKEATHVNLMVFPDKLRPGSQLLFTDPGTGQAHTLSPTP